MLTYIEALLLTKTVEASHQYGDAINLSFLPYCCIKGYINGRLALKMFFIHSFLFRCSTCNIFKGWNESCQL